jgi:TonB-dependent receptor
MMLAPQALAQSAAGETVAGGAEAAAQAPASAGAAQEPTSDAGDSIVVTGRRAALQAATERKRRSETIIDSVVADEAGKLPDNSITEVLQRVSGVSIVRFASLGDPDHFSVEGSGVQVRGLSGVASRLNGREIFSANNGRALLWGDVTPELMAAVDVYKASTADLIEGGTGGQIDLRTKLPFDYRGGWRMAGSGEISRGDLAEKTDYSASALLTNRWSTGIGDIGFLVDVAFSRLSSDSHFFRMESYQKRFIDGADYFIPNGFNYGEEQFQRRRTGIYGAVQWAPSDELTFTGTFFQSRYKNKSGDWGAFVGAANSVVDPDEAEFDEIGALVRSNNVFTRSNTTFLPNTANLGSGGNKGEYRSTAVTRDYALAFDWAPADSPVAVKGSIQRVDSTYLFNRLDVFRDVQFPINSFGLDLSGKLPRLTLPQSSQAFLDNPANYFWAASMPHNEDNKGRLDTANLDFEYRFDDSFFRSVKFGGRWADRTERDFNNGFNWSELGRGWTDSSPQLTFANAAPGDVEMHNFENFFRGEATLPGNLFFPSRELVSRMDRDQLHALPPTGFCGPAFGPLWGNCSAAGPLPQTGYGGQNYQRPVGFILPNHRTDYSTQTIAAYALVRFGESSGLGFSGNVGARIVGVKNRSSGYFQQSAGTTFLRNGQPAQLITRAEVRSGGGDFTRILPSFNVTYAPTDAVKMRLALNRTMDLPSFSALRATGTLGVSTLANPDNPPAPAPQLPPLFNGFTTDSGNPGLKPTMSRNLDLSVEWYPRQGTTAHLALFHKRITDLPIYTATLQPVTVYFADGTVEETFAADNDIANSDVPATVKGLEVGGRTFLDMLPGLLKGFGLEANYTFIDSKNPGYLYRDINGVTRFDLPIPGMSRHNYNLALLYEMNPVSFRVAYSWRSKYLQTTTGNGTNPGYDYYTAPGTPVGGCTNPANGICTRIQANLPVYGSSYGSLDAGIRFRFNDNISVGLQANNLLKTTQRTLMGGYPQGKLYTRSWFQSDQRIVLSTNIAF